MEQLHQGNTTLIHMFYNTEYVPQVQLIWQNIKDLFWLILFIWLILLVVAYYLEVSSVI